MKTPTILRYLFFLPWAIWFSGIGGRDLYLGGVFLFAGYGLYKKQHVVDCVMSCVGTLWDRNILLSLLGTMSGITMIVFILKYYSFSWHLFDVGLFSNVLYNIAQGDYYSSYFSVHALADHFTPSFSPLSFPYAIYPHVHWLTLAKLTAYLSCPLIAWRIGRVYFPNSRLSLSGLFLGLAWLLIYAPSVNGLYYEFQPSALSLPFILLAFLFYLKKNRTLFFISMIFLLGFKEHMGAVWIGFGLYMLLNDKKNRWLALMLIIVGVVSIYVIMFEVMPYYRHYEPAWNQAVAPFQNISGKLGYAFKLMAPLFFLPVIFWRHGIMAAPAIGVNVISGRANMVSMNHHYDDIGSVMLLIGLLSIMASHRHQISTYAKTMYGKVIMTVGIFSLLAMLPAAPLRHLYAAIPGRLDFAKTDEIIALHNVSDDTVIYAQTSLAPHFYRRNMRMLIQDGNGNCVLPVNRVKKTRLVFDTRSSYLMDFSKNDCVAEIKKNPRWRSIPTNTMHVFEFSP